MELNVWNLTTLTDAKWDDGNRGWTVTLVRRKANGEEETRVLHPRRVIQATVHSGEMKMPSIEGMDDFQSDRLCHSSQFRGAENIPHGQRKRTVVVCCCNSGHDIAQDFHEHGYDVTIVQRSSTYLCPPKTGWMSY